MKLTLNYLERTCSVPSGGEMTLPVIRHWSIAGETHHSPTPRAMCKWIFFLLQLQLKKGQLDFSSEKLKKHLGEREIERERPNVRNEVICVSNMSNFPFISKIFKKMVVTFLLDGLQRNSLCFNPVLELIIASVKVSNYLFSFRQWACFFTGSTGPQCCISYCWS